MPSTKPWRHLALSCSLVACSAESHPGSSQPPQLIPSVPQPHKPVSSPVYPPPFGVEPLNPDLQPILDKGSELVDSAKETLFPPPPENILEQPKPNIHSSPRNITNLTTATVPQTYTFEAAITNASKAWPVARYDWKIEKIGLPIFGQDELLAEILNSGPRIHYTFTQRATYRVTLTVYTAAGDQSSTSLLIWGRS